MKGLGRNEVILHHEDFILH